MILWNHSTSPADITLILMASDRRYIKGTCASAWCQIVNFVWQNVVEGTTRNSISDKAEEGLYESLMVATFPSSSFSHVSFITVPRWDLFYLNCDKIVSSLILMNHVYPGLFSGKTETALSKKTWCTCDECSKPVQYFLQQRLWLLFSSLFRLLITVTAVSSYEA